MLSEGTQIGLIDSELKQFLSTATVIVLAILNMDNYISLQSEPSVSGGAKRARVRRSWVPVGDVVGTDFHGGLLLPVPVADWQEQGVPPDLGDCAKEQHPPNYTPLLLQSLHPHSRDERIAFNSDEHSYHIDGWPTLGSVTGLVKQFSETFDADSVIERMIHGHFWPRPEYIRSDGVPMIPTEIKDLWEIHRAESAREGMWMHFHCELFLNRCLVSLCSAEMNCFMRFLGSLSGWKAYRTEWRVFGEEERIAGTIDFVAEAADSSLLIVDWKRSKDLNKKYQNVFRSMLHTLDGLPDCSGQHYRLQVNCYRYLLEKYYGRVVSKMLIVAIHPQSGPDAFIDDVPVLEAETDALMQWQRDRARPVEYAV